MPDCRERVSKHVFSRLKKKIAIGNGEREIASVIAPFTCEKISEIPKANENDVLATISKARYAQMAWKNTAFREKTKIFIRYHDLILDRKEEILDIIQLETGKSRLNALEEVLHVAIVARHYSYHGKGLIRPKRRKGVFPIMTHTWEIRQPRGVVSFISPWNYPLSLSIADAIPALIAGNAVVLKPDLLTPYTALWAVELLEIAGLPKDLFNVLTGSGRELGEVIIKNSDYVCFTGSTKTGKEIARTAGKMLIDCSLELGGKNPMIVFSDADIERAVEGGIVGCFSNTGQLCMSIERIYVQSEIYETYLRKYIDRVKRIKIGAGFKYGIEMGSLTSEEQMNKVRDHVNEAIEKGAKVETGGKAIPSLGPLFYQPTVLTGVNDTMKVAREETFGPVVSMYKYDTIEQAIMMANDSNYGLNASVWTRNTRIAKKIAMRIRAGTVNINESYAATFASIDAPMGGFKESGTSRRHGKEGILKYTEPQTVSIQKMFPIAPSIGSYHERYARGMSTVLRIVRRTPGLR